MIENTIDDEETSMKTTTLFNKLAFVTYPKGTEIPALKQQNKLCSKYENF